jgi:WD40 repeat protein
LFTPDSKHLVASCTDSVVRVVRICETGDVEIVASFKNHLQVHNGKASVEDVGEDAMEIDGPQETGGPISKRKKKTELVCSLAISSDGQWLATGDLSNNIFIFNLDSLQVSIFCISEICKCVFIF